MLPKNMRARHCFVLFAIFVGRIFGAEPAYLEPVSAFDRDDYIQAVYKLLVQKTESRLWMINLPSFVPEYAILVRRQCDTADPKQFQFFIEVAQPESPIFGWADDGDGTSHVVYDEKVAIERKSKLLTDSDVQLLARAAFEVLKKTRIPEFPRQGCDGETFIFCLDSLAGKIWCPDFGEPALLEKAWSALASFVRAKDPSSEEAALSGFRSACAGILKPDSEQAASGNDVKASLPPAEPEARRP